MDTSQQQKSALVRQRSIVPSCNGPRRLAFRIRKRGFTFEGSASLLISNRFGVWSVGHRRYIRETRLHRYHKLKEELGPVRRHHRTLVAELGVDKWPEYGEAVRSLRRKLADFYWSVMPEEEKTRTIGFYRERRERWSRDRRSKRLVWFAAPPVWMAVLGFVLLRLVLLGRYNVWVSMCLGSGYLAAVYLLEMGWHAYCFRV